MKNENGALRYVVLFFFAFLFLSAAALSAYVALPIRIEQTAQIAADRLPLSLPELRVVANEPFSERDKEELALHGEAVLYRRELLCTARLTDTEEASDVADAALYTLNMADADGFYSLTAGRMPQNETECVISTARGLFYEIGDTLVLWSGEEPLYRLTVVGLAEDSDSMLCAFDVEHTQDEIPALHIYRPETDGMETAGDTARYVAAIAHVEDAGHSSEALWLYAQAKYSASGTEAAADTSALDAAQAAVNEADIKSLRIQNQILSLNVAASEAEAEYLLASEALETERQEFISSMQRHEAVRANQTHLITRKEAAEETFAKKEAELAELYAQIEQIYSDRDALKLLLAEAEANAAAAKDALAQLKVSGDDAEDTAQTVFMWSITAPRDRETGDSAYIAMLSSDKHIATGFLITAILAIGLMAASILFWRGKCGLTTDLGMKHAATTWILLSIYAILTAALGASVGGLIISAWKFAHAFKTFDGALAHPMEVLPPLAVTALSLAVVFIALNVLGEWLWARANALTAAQNASLGGE